MDDANEVRTSSCEGLTVKHSHQAYYCPHPRQAGYLVYCADCDWTAEGPTAAEAIDNWFDRKCKRQRFDRSEITDFEPIF